MSADLQNLRRFSVRLVTPIVGPLWMGGVLPGVRLPDDFRRVVSLHPAEKYDLGPDTERVEFDLIDLDQLPDTDLLHRIADRVLEWTGQGEKTLVHCQAGLNRSGLITALTMIKAGWDPSMAISELRHLRHPDVLFNGVFEQWLLQQDGVPS